jgi:hypothetical protein
MGNQSESAHGKTAREEVGGVQELPERAEVPAGSERGEPLCMCNTVEVISVDGTEEVGVCAEHWSVKQQGEDGGRDIVGVPVWMTNRVEHVDPSPLVRVERS